MDIRNICLLGHGGSGKTSLVESMLYITGATDRLGKTADGNTVCDYDPEETKRQISISLAMAPVMYQGVKINVLDTPGNFDFAARCSPASGPPRWACWFARPRTGSAWARSAAGSTCGSRRSPASSISPRRTRRTPTSPPPWRPSGRISPSPSPRWWLPSGMRTSAPSASSTSSTRRPTRWAATRRAPGWRFPFPRASRRWSRSCYDQLMEAVAETTEENMEKFFAGEPFTKEEIMTGLKVGMHEGTLAPVVCGSAFTGLGTEMLLQTIVDLVPGPLEVPAEEATDESGENAVEVAHDPNGPTAAIVFKTISDQYGKYSLVKVVSGKITGDMSLYNPTTGKTEKLGRLYTLRGKKTEEVKEIACGDIGAIAKMDRLKTGDTLCDPKKVVRLTPVQFAEPCYSRAIAPKTRGQDEKVGSGLVRLNEEDPTFSVVNNAETHQVVVSGAGDIQIDVLVSKLKSRFGVEAELDTPRVAYREKIRKKVRKQGRHKKQTGGSGQFGDVHIVFEPQDESEDMIFAEEVFGGSVPKNFFPAVEKGLREACQHGVLAGYPVVFLKATLVDGSYHPVDSSEIAFKTAAQLAYKGRPA